MEQGTEQRMADLPAVVNDAASAIDYSLNILGVMPNNLHLFAMPEDRETIQDLLIDDDAGMDVEEMKRNPDEHVQMRWRTGVKAKYDFMYDYCLTDE